MTLTIYRELTQGTDEWLDARRGIITASVVGQLITVGSLGAIDYECPTCLAIADFPCVSVAKGKPAEPIKTMHPARTQVAIERADQSPPVLTVADTDRARKLIDTLAAERIGGYTQSQPITSDMWRGIDCEPLARDFYGGHFSEVEECGFMKRDESGWTLGFSPDGLVGDVGLVEIKAPRDNNHVRTVVTSEVPPYYIAQCQAGLLVSGREWLDFVSFAGGLAFWVQRVLPDPAWHEVIVKAVTHAEGEIRKVVADYESKVAGLPVPDRVDLDLVVA